MAFQMPKSATAAEIAQAQSLISRGKESACRGDAKMQRIVSAIKYLSQEQVRQHISNLQAQGYDTLQHQVDVTKGQYTISGVEAPQPKLTPGQQMLEQAGVPTGDIKSILAARKSGATTPSEYIIGTQHSAPKNYFTFD